MVDRRGPLFRTNQPVGPSTCTFGRVDKLVEPLGAQGISKSQGSQLAGKRVGIDPRATRWTTRPA